MSVSSTRRMKTPPSAPLANSQLNKAVRAFPTCNWPVGLGAKRTRTGIWLDYHGEFSFEFSRPMWLTSHHGQDYGERGLTGRNGLGVGRPAGRGSGKPGSANQN